MDNLLKQNKCDKIYEVQGIKSNNLKTTFIAANSGKKPP
jgi:hypothetical protein